MAEVSALSNLLNNIINPAKANRFLVRIVGSNEKSEYQYRIGEGTQYLCHTAQLPGKTFATLEQKTYGPIQKIPYLTTYNDLDLTFYVSAKQRNIYDDFTEWMNVINPIDTNDFAYRVNYQSDIIVTQYDDNTNVIKEIKFVEAYPISMNQLDLDWSSETFQNLTVSFAYTRWEKII
jgi:hypothetical protein